MGNSIDKHTELCYYISIGKKTYTNKKGTNKMKNYKEMKVVELKQESRKRGMTLEKNGHKFNKTELIERLEERDRMEEQDIKNDIEKAINESGEEQNKEVKEEKKKVYRVYNKDTYIKFAETLEQIEKKYSVRKQDKIYDNELQVGSFVVFIHYVEAANGNIYKKLRTAKVIGVNRKKELVKVETFLGTQKTLSYDELLYIKAGTREATYPKDISVYLRNQRTEKGKELINDRYAERNR